MEQPPVVFTPTLTEVQSRFISWRMNKKHSSHRIPEDLWAAAVMLTKEHSLHKVCRALSLGYKDLKKKSQLHFDTPTDQTSKCSQEFIPINIAQDDYSAECMIEMEHRNGNKMRMHFRGKADLDLQSFAESFWGKRA